MSEVGDTFAALAELRRKKRASNREYSTELLIKRGISYTSKNGGLHLIIDGPTGPIDFWPGTGLWNNRKGLKSRGVRKLIDHINKEKDHGTGN